nr:MBL fold metallo-hydrolase [Gordonia sp. LAM0048]
MSTAVVYGDQVYVFDLGLGAVQRLRNSGAVSKDTAPTFLRSVRGIFFTHMHSDHLADWPALYAIGPSNNLGDTAREPIVVRGPGSRGVLPRVFPPSRPEPAVVNPALPTPGIDQMARYLDQAWAADLNDRVRDNNAILPSNLFDVGDIDLSGIWDVSPSGIPPRLAKPIPVHKDGDVTITATLVDHRPTAPAFAYRVDTPDGSVVISGDTTVSANLIDLAQGADYLVHEVIDPFYIRQVTSALPTEIAGPIRQHLVESHTTIEQVGRDVAQPARVKNLVLTHLVPAAAPATTFQAAKEGFAGKLIVGEDLMDLPVR